MPICLGTGTQYPSPREDEDCLFINVWSPADATEDSKLPVWFYIQGGGYSSNANANYNGSEVVVVSGQNIVFVNFNYRVGSWGFLASEKVRADGNLNVGLLDQRFAMEWMQKHIAKVSLSSVCVLSLIKRVWRRSRSCSYTWSKCRSGIGDVSSRSSVSRPSSVSITPANAKQWRALRWSFRRCNPPVSISPHSPISR